MKFNLNDKMYIGIDVQRKTGRKTAHEFQRIATTENMQFFLDVCQYLLESMPDTSRVCIIHTPSDKVLDFTGVCNHLGLKSTRYGKGE